MAELCGKEIMIINTCSSRNCLSFFSEASAILKRLIERLHPYSTAEQQADIDSLQHILDSPLFRKLYNLQQSLQRLKTEYETGNQFIRNCLFDFDLNGHLQIIQNNIEANLSSKSESSCTLFD